MKDGRLIIDGAAAGSLNMGIDEALLKTASEQGACVLRFYQWSEPTLSLGYFQKYKDRSNHQESSLNTCVRRSTGGGAILHDNEITYSLCMPNSNRFSKQSELLYATVHEAIIESLLGQNILAEKAKRIQRSPEPFLCFQRRAGGDILIDGIKVCGSAQRRWKNAILQHGSLLLAKSSCAPQLAGIKEITGIFVKASQLIESLVGILESKLRISFVQSEISTEIASLGKKIETNKYSNPQWTAKR